MRGIHKQVILAMADNNMGIGATAKQLNYHRNTVDWHLHRIYLEYGLDPKRFYDLVKLVEIAEAEEKESKV